MRPLVLVLGGLLVLGAIASLAISAYLTWEAVRLLGRALYILFG